MWPDKGINIIMLSASKFRFFFTITFLVLIVYVLLVSKVIDVMLIRDLYSDFRSSSSGRCDGDMPQQLYSEQNIKVLRAGFFKYVASKLANTPYPGVENYTQYVIAKSKLKPLSGIKSLRPEFGPVLNDVTSFQYPFGIKPCKYVNGTSNLFVAIITAVGNFDKRQIIRRTWLKQIRQIYLDVNGSLVSLSGYGFITGQTKDQNVQLQMEEESKKHDDIVQMNFIDNYYNLTLKVVGLVNWLNKYCSGINFVLKVDDDVFVNVRNLRAIISKTMNPSRLNIYGSQIRHSSVRGGKWSVSYEDWPWSNYPDYPTGGSVLLPGIAIGPLLAATQVVPYLPFDDTYLLGLCTEKAGIKIHGFGRFFATVGQPTPCFVYKSITWLVSSLNSMNNSYWATEEFYSNVTQCIASDSVGMDRTINPLDYLLQIN